MAQIDLSWADAFLALLIAAVFFGLGIRFDYKKVSNRINEVGVKLSEGLDRSSGDLSKELARLSALVELYVPFLDKKLREMELTSDATPVEKKIFSELISREFRTRTETFANSKIIIEADFDRGWRLLFDETMAVRQGGTLRDVTFSSHGDTTIQTYDFDSYPKLVREYIYKYDKNLSSARFMMIIGPSQASGENNQRAEKFLCSLLEMKYLHNPPYDKLFRNWRDGIPGNRSNIEVMISTEGILNRVAGPFVEIGAISVDSPFNVYGDFAISRSVVRSSAPVKPLPHLEISTDQRMVEKYSRIFDRVWEESVPFKARVASGVSDEQALSLGSGRLFGQWAVEGG